MKQLQRKFDLEYARVCLAREAEEQEEARREALYNKREADARVREYKGSFQSLKDRFSGIQAEKQETLNREASHAAAHLNATLRRVEEIKAKQQAVEAELEVLGEVPCPETREAAQRKAPHLIRMVLPVLEENLQSLQAELEWTRPRIAADTTYAKRRDNLYPAKDRARTTALEIAKVLEELNRALALIEKPEISIAAYFKAPDSYLVAAMPYGALDRINAALNANRSCQKALLSLQIEME